MCMETEPLESPWHEGWVTVGVMAILHRIHTIIVLNDLTWQISSMATFTEHCTGTGVAGGI